MNIPVTRMDHGFSKNWTSCVCRDWDKKVVCCPYGSVKKMVTTTVKTTTAMTVSMLRLRDNWNSSGVELLKKKPNATYKTMYSLVYPIILKLMFLVGKKNLKHFQILELLYQNLVPEEENQNMFSIRLSKHS